jgi:1-acyl-sn-glycerol-3-phosphate acyltransferase
MRAASIFLRLYLLWARIFYRLKIDGSENLPKEGGLVIVFNHIAPIIDGITAGIIFFARPDAASFGGAALPRGGLLGRFITRQRSSQSSFYLSAVKARGLSGMELVKALDFLKSGRAIALAAEGEISWDGNLQYPLAPGAAWMALRANVPVIACVSIGGYDVMPRWSRVPRLFGKVRIRVGEPFRVSDSPITKLSDELLNEANDKIYQEMKTLIDSTNNK